MKKFTLCLAVAAVFTTAANAQVPPNDECTGAIDINSVFGHPVDSVWLTAIYDNTNATISANDPLNGYECFGEPTGAATNPSLEKTVWFTFTGDGERYFIETTNGAGITDYIEDGDTQIAIYTGTCGALVPFACNEDGPSAGPNGTAPYPAGLTIATTVGTVYYMMVDGFLLNNNPNLQSAGEFMIEVTKELTVDCNSTLLTLGSYSADRIFICRGDSVRFSIDSVIAPNVGDVSGLGWLISAADISGNNDPMNDPSFVAGYAVQSPVPDSSFRQYKNDSSLIGTAAVPFGTYYWTPVIFGNATINPNFPGGTLFMTYVILDPTCTLTGTSIPVDVRSGLDPLCFVGIEDLDGSGFGIAGIHPVPVSNELNFTLTSTLSGVVEVSVKDNLGREVVADKVAMTPGEKKLTYDASALTSGVYFITITSGNAVKVAKFVKQ